MDALDYFKIGKEYFYKNDYIQANENFWKAMEMVYDPTKVAMFRENTKKFDPDVVALNSFETLRSALGVE